jgi:ankyrin repeat protein
LKVEDIYSKTPLLLAAAHGHEEIVRFLAEKGANIEPEGNDHVHNGVLGASVCCKESPRDNIEMG